MVMSAVQKLIRQVGKHSRINTLFNPLYCKNGNNRRKKLFHSYEVSAFRTTIKRNFEQQEMIYKYLSITAFL